MDSAILTTLPSIHSTLIGIGAAFYSAYAIYAYQKIQEARIRLERTSKDATNFAFYVNTFSIMANDPLLTDGVLEYETCKTIIKQQWFIIKNEPNKEICESLCRLFGLLYLSPPFSIKATTNPNTSKTLKPTPNLVDDERLSEISLRLSAFAFIWRQSKDDILNVAKLTTLQEKQANIEKQHKELEQNPTILPEERAAIWAKYYENNPLPTIDYESIIRNGFEGVVRYRDSTLIELRSAVENYNLFNSHFQIKKTTMKAIGVVALLLTTGVFLPPVLLSIQADYSVKWPKELNYLLLYITIIPYIGTLSWIWKKLSNANIQ
jgi:hypothetical protein